MINKKIRLSNYNEFEFSEMVITPITIDSSNTNRPITKNRIIKEILKIYNTFCIELLNLEIGLSDNEIEVISNLILSDLKARIEQDPIALSEEFIYSLSRSFRVILYYRIAHVIYNKNEANDRNNLYKYCAFKISEYATTTTAIEIHPEAKIGKAFVIDHGVNTLIGATSKIGNHCTILQNVVLGSRKITYNEKGKRHPTIGDNVHISGGARILGPIKIGNNVIIGPDCLVAKNIPNFSVVKLDRKQTIIVPANK